MGKPRLMILIRHAQSEGNQNRALHQIIPDHRVKLTAEGWQQARDAGRRLHSMLRPNDTIQIFTSPYRRTKETTEGILETLTAPSPGRRVQDEHDSPSSSPSPPTATFARSAIKVYEEPRIREQDFGNFQPCEHAMSSMWKERADYGHFFYRIPNGESAADAYDRCASFNETLFRNFDEPDFPSVCILVTHGLLARVFLMKWFHWSTDYFEDLRNVDHCEFIVMRRRDDADTIGHGHGHGHGQNEASEAETGSRAGHGDGKYVLENRLRTWSEMEDKAGTATATIAPSVVPNPSLAAALRMMPKSPSIPARMWGGCIGGCNHANEMYPAGVGTGTGSAAQTALALPSPARDGFARMEQGVSPVPMRSTDTDDDHVRSDEERAYSEPESPDGSDGPGSSAPSQSGQDAAHRRRRPSRRQPTEEDLENWLRQSGMGTGARADALGDEPDLDDDFPPGNTNDAARQRHIPIRATSVTEDVW